MFLAFSSLRTLRLSVLSVKFSIFIFSIFSPTLRLSRRASAAHHPFQIPQTRRHTILRRNLRRSQTSPPAQSPTTRIPILNQRPKERRKIDIPFPNHGEHLVLNRLFKSPVPLTRLLQHLRVAILNMQRTASLSLTSPPPFTESPWPYTQCPCPGKARSLYATSHHKTVRHSSGVST